MNKLTEDKVEYVLIDLLKEQDYRYFYGPEIAPYSENAQREGFSSVLLEKIVKESLERLNPNVPKSEQKNF